MTKSFQRRLEILDACLQRSLKIWTIETLLETMQEKLSERGLEPISIRTLYNDLDYLQYELKAPVEKYKDGRKVCYRYQENGFSLFQSPLSSGEIELLQSLLHFLKSTNAPLAGDLEELIARQVPAADSMVTASSDKLGKSMTPSPAQAEIPGKSIEEGAYSVEENEITVPLREISVQEDSPGKKKEASEEKLNATELAELKIIIRMRASLFQPFAAAFENWRNRN